jgi:hypothetical protein
MALLQFAKISERTAAAARAPLEFFFAFAYYWFYREISTLISKSGAEIGFPMPASKFRFRNDIRIEILKPKLKFQFRRRNKNFGNQNIEISTKLGCNFVGISINSKVTDRNRNQNQNFDKIGIKLGNFDFAESKKMSFVETISISIGLSADEPEPSLWDVGLLFNSRKQN